MDSVLAALIRSRSKSIGTLMKDCIELRARVAASKVPAAAAALQGQLRVKEQRLARLQEEMEGLRQEAELPGQLPIPGALEAPPAAAPAAEPAAAVPPVVRKRG